LKDAIQKHTNVEQGTQEEEIILNDKFLTQSAPDIHRKLQKLVAEPGKSLDQLVQVATTIFYNRDLEKKRRKDKHQEVMIEAMQVNPSGAHPNTWAYFLCGQEGHFRRVPTPPHRKGKDHLWDPATSVRGTPGTLCT
jgi:hypothetical protein